jgi:flagellar hook-length control protein FliK
MAAAATPNTASNPLAALGGSARVPDDSGSGSGTGSGDSGAPSFNSALAAAQSGQSSQSNSGNAAQAGSNASSATAACPGQSDGGASDPSNAAATVLGNVGPASPTTTAAKVAAKGIAARAATNPGAAKMTKVALPAVPGAALEQTADADDSLAASNMPVQSAARDSESADDAVSAKDASTDVSTAAPAIAASTLSASMAQSLAGLVHQLLAKDSPAESAPVATASSEADAAVASIAGAGTMAARTALAAASLAELVLTKSDPDSDSGADPGDAITAADPSGQGAASAAALAVAAGTQSPATTAIPERVITVPVQSSQWPQALGTEIRWLTGQNIQSAVLRLSPDHLGPVQVNINVNASHVSVSFDAAHPDTRAALEQAMPRLRDMLSGAGLTLGEATVQQQSRQASQNPNPAARSLLSAADTDAQPASAVRWSSGLVDEYA